MPSGGKREGAGRPPKRERLSPRVREEVSNKIKTEWLIKKLNAHIENPDGGMVPSAVTAALGLLRKKLPDLASVEHKGSIETKPAELMTDDELAGNIAAARAVLTGVEPDASTSPSDPSKLH